MKTRNGIVFFHLFFLLFFTQEIRSHDQILRKGDGSALKSASIDSFITSTMSDYHIPGLSACIVKDGELVWHHAYGFADVEKEIPVTDSTLFDLASISKVITGTALMQLHERGFINLDENVNTYLPADLQVENPLYPNDPITVKMILSHVSSIRDNSDVLGPLIVAGDSPIKLSDFLKSYFVPGGACYTDASYDSLPPASTYNYSNTAIALLGYLVEAITHTTFDEYCQQHIFAPLSMDETSWCLSNLDTSHIARPYTWSSYGYVSKPHRGYPYYPAGLLRSSSLQLTRFLNAFMNEGELGNFRMLDSSTVSLMTMAHFPGIPLPIPKISQGLVWFRRYFGNRLTWGHTGIVDIGATAAMFYYEPEKSGVIVLTNQYGWESVSKIVSALFDYAATIPTGFAESDEILLDDFVLRQNYPNPFNPSTTIEYILPKAGYIRLVICDLLGREIRTLMDEKQPAGHFQTSWDGTDEHSQTVAAGVYFCVLQSGEWIAVKKLVLLK